jgi:hypothetical protein
MDLRTLLSFERENMQILTSSLPIYAIFGSMHNEAQKPTSKVTIGDQFKEPMVEAYQAKLEGFKILFTMLRVSEILDKCRREKGNVILAVDEAKHILAEVIGAKECTCNMCMCDALAENDLTGGLN